MVESWKFLKFWEHTWPELKMRVIDNQEIGYVFPEYKNWFKALELTKPEDVKVVILGQDPYPTKGHAHGLSFSVQPHVRKLPGSLKNILAEYQTDLGYSRPISGCLVPWANNGVLLLNSILTVEEGKPLSHAGLGWEKLTYEIVRKLGERDDIVFILWGKRAQEYEAAIERAHIICGAHPSPRNDARGGFLGGRYFSRANEYLKSKGVDPVQWKLP